MKISIQTELRAPGLFGNAGRATYKELVRNQPLLLVREPGNPVDPNAIMVQTLMGAPCGYVAREVARSVAPDIDAGNNMWLCKMLTPWPHRPWAIILLWKDTPTEKKTTRIRERENA